MKRHVHVTAVALTVLAASAMARSAAAAVYTFEGLSAGTLAGQDNWAKSGPTYNGGLVTTGAGVNGTKVAAGSSETNSATETAVGRVNDGNWSYPLDFNDTSYALQVDTRYGGSTYWTFGYDANSNGSIAYGSGEIAGLLFVGSSVIGANVTGAWTFDSSLPATTNAGDWLRVAWVTDWTTGTYGTMSVYMKNLTDGETDFQPIAGLQGLDINGLDWGTWRANATGDASKAGLFNLVDNADAFATFGLNFNNTQFDNITVGHFVLPEPASLSLLGIGGVLLLRRRRS